MQDWFHVWGSSTRILSVHNVISDNDYIITRIHRVKFLIMILFNLESIMNREERMMLTTEMKSNDGEINKIKD